MSQQSPTLRWGDVVRIHGVNLKKDLQQKSQGVIISKRGVLKAADEGQGAFKIDVTSQLSSQIVFKITSHRTYQHQNDKIYYQDALQIYHKGADCYMNFAQISQKKKIQNQKKQVQKNQNLLQKNQNTQQQQNCIFLDRNIPQIQNQDNNVICSFSKNRPLIKKPINKRIPVVNQNKYKCLWKFYKHCDYYQNQSNNKIKLHDIVYFKHTMNQGLVASLLSKVDQPYYLHQENSNQNQNQQVYLYNSFWQLIPTYGDISKNGQQNSSKKKKQQNPPYWLRHLITGQILTYKNQKNQYFNVQVHPQISKQQSEQNQIQFQNQCLVNLICSQNSLKIQRGKQMYMNSNLTKIQKIYEQNIRKLQFTAVQKLPKDIFKIYKVNQKTLLDLQFALSSHQQLVKVIQYITYNLIKHKQYIKFISSLKQIQDNLSNITTIMKMLIGKIYNTFYQQIQLSGSLPDKRIQKILVQTGIVQLIIQIINLLYQPFKYIQQKFNTQPDIDRAISNRICQIFQYSYIFLQKVAVNNQKNRMYISRWVQLFLQHGDKINQQYIQQCLIGILQNNPKAIKATINQQKINKLTQSFINQGKKISDGQLTTKYLKLFSTFIVCQDQVIRQNQLIILKSFLKNKQNMQRFKLYVQSKPQDKIKKLDPNDPLFKIKSKQVFIQFKGSQKIKINNFYNDWNNKWKYFIAFINLLADVCLDRNNQAIKNISTFVTLQMVAIILYDDQYNQKQQGKNQLPAKAKRQLHQAFIRIAHNLYINNDKFEIIQRIQKICKWYRNSSLQDQQKPVQNVNTTKRLFQGQKQQQQKYFLNSVLQYIKNYLSDVTQNSIQQISMLYTILDLLKTTIQLGLWSDIQQFRKLIPLIVKRIIKIPHDKLFYDKDSSQRRMFSVRQMFSKKIKQLQMNRPQNLKIIDCKIKATQIFKQMNEYQIDIRLRYIMNFFKGLYQTTQDFNLYDKPIKDQQIKIKQIKGKQINMQKAMRQQQSIKNRNQIAKKQFLKKDTSKILGQVKKISQDQQIMLKTNVWYNKLNQMTPYQYQKQKQPKYSRYIFKGGIHVQQGQSIQQAYEQNLKFVVSSILQLPIYENIKLLDSSLKMLRSIFQQRKQLINNFKSILICGKGNLQQVYLSLQFMRNKFQMLTNVNIVKYDKNQDSSFSYALWKQYDPLIKQQDKKSGIIQDLFFLAKTLKQNVSLKNIQQLMKVDNSLFQVNRVRKFIDERQKNNDLFQALNIAQGIYIPLVQYIKIVGDMKFKQKKVYQDQKNKKKFSIVIQQNQIHYKLLISIYQYLSLICFNNLQAKQLMIQYIPYVLHHLKSKVGAASFLNIIITNNKMLINNQKLVQKIIQASLDACLKNQQVFQGQGNKINAICLIKNAINIFSKPGQQVFTSDYQIGQIFQALRGLVIYNDNGYKKNQQLLLNKLQDHKYKKLIYQKLQQQQVDIPKVLYDVFQLSTSDSYIDNHFQLFASLVQSKNLINIGKLQNIHPYTYCLQLLKKFKSWQVRKSIRSYINRLYYINKQKDVFLFEQFIRKQFDIINCQLNDLITLHTKKTLKIQTVIQSGIRFKYAVSQIMVFIIQILISIYQILLKTQFKRLLYREIQKQQKYPESSRPLHQKLIKLFKNLGAIFKLYQQTKPIRPYLDQVKIQISQILMKLKPNYLKTKFSPETQSKSIQTKKIDQIGAQNQVDQNKKQFVYDSTKSFFRNLGNMLRQYRIQRKKLQQLQQSNKNQQDGKMNQNQSPQKYKKRMLNKIFNTTSQLQPVHTKKKRRGPTYYNSYLQTTNSRAFKVLAKPEISDNQQNIQLNNQLKMVKKKLDQCPQFIKFQQDQHLIFVRFLSQINETSKNIYLKDFKQTNQNPVPVISMKQTLSTIMKLIVKINDSNQTIGSIGQKQKIFIVKTIRCYITQAVQKQQNYKYPVDKWQSDYFEQVEDQPKNLQRFQQQQQQLSKKDQLIKRQNLIQQCGGSDFIISILSEQNLHNRIQLLNQILLLGIAYLFGGNQNCQNSILNCLKKDSNNKMLLNIKRLIKFLGQFIISIRANKQINRSQKFSPIIADTFNFFSIQNYSMQRKNNNNIDRYQIQILQDNQKAFCRFFRFLQLFCQNNNKDMKKFLFSQINQDNSKKTNSVNFIQQACLLLRKLFKIMNNKVVQIPQNILQFICQITQLPCIDNQISLMKSTFFEDISYLSSYFENYNNFVQRNFQSYQKLQQIYQQGINLILSNFQGNDQIIIHQFLNKCNPKYLWIVMKNNLFNWIKLQQKQQQQLQKIKNKKNIQKQKDQDKQNNQNQEQQGDGFPDKEQLQKTFAKFNKQEIKKMIQHKKSQNKIFQDDHPVSKIINIKCIFKKLDDFQQVVKSSSISTKQFQNQFIEFAKEQFPQIQYFLYQIDKQYIRSIQVTIDNGKQTKQQNIYFSNHPVFAFLSQQTKNFIMMEVGRDTRRDKLTDLIKFKQSIKQEIQSNYNLSYNSQQKVFKWQITSSFADFVYYSTRIISYIICFLTLFTIIVDHDTDDQVTNYNFENKFYQFVLNSLRVSQFSITIFYCYIWWKMRTQLALKKYNQTNQQDQGIHLQPYQDAKVQKINQGWTNIIDFINYFNQKINKFSSSILKYCKKSKFYKKIVQPVFALQRFESSFNQMLIFLIASYLGLFYGVQWYYLHIFDYFANDVPLLANVFKAILDNIGKLSMFSLLAGTFILVFNIIFFGVYSSSIYAQDNPKQACQSIIQCVLQLYTKGVIGQNMQTFQIPRFSSDTIYTVFMSMLFTSLIQNIIVDSFGQLKQNDNKRQDDKKGMCYICFMEPGDIEKQGDTFQSHTNNKHYLWNYVFYLYCLNTKQSTDYTGIQYTITQFLKSQDISWFPYHGQDNNDQQVKTIVKQVQDKISYRASKLQNIINKSFKAIKQAKKSIQI